MSLSQNPNIPAPSLSVPDTRLVCRFTYYGGPERLDWHEEPLRKPGLGEVLVEVHAVSVNPVDWKVLDGRMKPMTPPGKGPFKPHGFGTDYAGTVLAVGPGVKSVAPGDTVMGFLNPVTTGAWATHVLAPALLLIKAPGGFTAEQLATLPGSGLGAIHVIRKLSPKRWKDAKVLLNGAAGGVGNMVLQILSSMGARVHAVASEARHAGLFEFGAASASDYRTTPTETLGKRFDVVVDAHGSLLHTDPRIFFAPDSRIKCFVMVSIPNPAIPVTIARIVLRAFAGIRSGMVVPIPYRSIFTRLKELTEQGILKPAIQKVYPRAGFREAVTASIAGHGFGKFIVRIKE